ncbi:hypothetical protein [Halopseudomonas bauzanensis]|uniref:hypothetical protein n=1 Tax=Halopseudomonas bauzanensis TaxID=653930 RepID=UPI00115FBBCB|nr:hypothetical protein [Halopseudomonas bauzanensis]
MGQLVEQWLWKVEPDDQLRWADDGSFIELVLDVPRKNKPVFPGRVEHQLDQWRRRQTSQPDQTSPMKAG